MKSGSSRDDACLKEWPLFSDFRVWTEEKLHYIHRNPVKRGLVERPEDGTHRARAAGDQEPGPPARYLRHIVVLESGSQNISGLPS